MNKTNTDTTRFYYLRNDDGHPFGCVCLIRDPKTNSFARGISVCNVKRDTFARPLARNLAEGRALRAIAKNENDRFMFARSTSLAETFKQIKAKYGIGETNKLHLGQTNATLSPFEERMWEDVFHPELHPSRKSK